MTDSIAPDLRTVSTGGLLGQPRGLYTLALTEMWERFSFYGMRALLILFMLASPAAGGLGLAAHEAGAIYGLYTAGVYLFSLPGGWIADRLLGQQSAVLVGGALISVGNLSLGIDAGAPAFFLGLAVIALGVGLLKPNISVMVGELYKDDSDSRRDAAFSIFYLGISFGAFIAPLIAGTLGETYGYRWGFVTAGVAMILGLIQYVATAKSLSGAGGKPEAVSGGDWGLLGAGASVVTVAAIALAGGFVRLSVVHIAGGLGAAMAAVAVLFFGGVLFDRTLSAMEKRRIVMIAALFLACVVFITGLEQTGSTMNLFARDFTDRSFLGSLFTGGQHPTSWYQSVEPVFVLLLSPVFAWAWLSLGKRNRDLSAAAKFGLALVAMALAFLVMTFAASSLVHGAGKASPAWLVGTYLLLTLGELLISPIGLSSISRLAPRRYVGQMMGMWFLAAAIGNLVAGLLGGAAAGGGLASMPRQFLTMALFGAVAGVAMLIAARPLRRWLGA